MRGFPVMAKKAANRRSTPEFDLGTSTTPPKQKKAAERTETPEKPIPGFIADKIFGPGFYDPKPDEQPAAVPPASSPAEYIVRQYGIEPNCTNVPRLLYAILCEVVRGRV